MATAGGHKQIVEALFTHDGSILAEGEDIPAAIRRAIVRNHQPVLKSLLKWGRRLGLEAISEVDGKYTNKVQRALREDLSETVRILMGKRAVVDENGGTRSYALQAAANRGSEEEVLDLLDLGADINNCDSKRGSELDAAAAKGNLKMVHILLEKGAKVILELEDSGFCRTSALVRAASAGHGEVVELLVEKSPGIDAWTLEGTQPGQ
jgi:ankyrin repeat protein